MAADRSATTSGDRSLRALENRALVTVLLGLGRGGGEETAFLLGQINNCVVIFISAAPGGSAVGAGIGVYEATDAGTVAACSFPR